MRPDQGEDALDASEPAAGTPAEKPASKPAKKALRTAPAQKSVVQPKKNAAHDTAETPRARGTSAPVNRTATTPSVIDHVMGPVLAVAPVAAAPAAPAAPASAPGDRGRSQGSAAPEAGVEVDATLIKLDDELHELYRRAQWLGGQGRDPLVSFTSLFLAFLGGGTPIAEWVRATGEDMKLDPQVVLVGWEQRQSSSQRSAYPPGLRVEHVRAPYAPPPRGNDMTPRARGVLEAAVAYQSATGAPALGARHVFAVYAFGPVGHERDFEAWRFRRRSWAARFAAALCQLAPEEAETWRSAAVAGWTATPSPRLYTVLQTAEVLAEQRGAPAIDVDDLVHALLLCASQWPADQRANVWLLSQLGEGALRALQVPALSSHLAAVVSGTMRHSGPRLPRSQQAAAWLRDAQLWALCGRSDELLLRHVIAALVAPRGPAAGKRMLRNAGGRPTQLADDLAHLIQRGEPHEDHATWQWLLANDAPPREYYKPGYANDVARGSDALAIGGDVRALASVLASVDTRPPLSVGLFGNWGSGKSFFMAMLRDHIRTLADRSCGAKHTAYCSEIAQIEFNAWHYVDGDLWASLVSHVLDRLEGYFRGDSQSVAEQRRVELATTQLRRAELERQQHTLDERRQKFESDVNAFRPSTGQLAGAIEGEIEATLKDRTAEAHVEVRKALDDVGRKLGIPAGELTLSKARQHVNAVRAWWSRLSLRSVIVGGIILTVAAGAALAAAKLRLSLVALAAAIAPAIVMVERILKIGLPIARAAQQASALGQKVTDRLARTRPEAFHEQQEIETAQSALAAERQRLDRRTDELRALLDTGKKPGMRDYVLERVSQYKNRLGIIASVHRDFQNLSDQLRDDTTEPKLQRIILYIDDLDRCPPKRVVEMLQAIHLLLSFELFVVVVAVDPKWLLRSLQAYYARQFAGCEVVADDREARPQFYLEKIFQIPYALRPLNATRFGSMVGALLEPAVHTGVESAPAAASIDPAPAPPDPVPAARLEDVAVAAPAAATIDVDLTPRNLNITARELDHLRMLGPLVSSPRAAKRLTNLYRIVRAGLSGDELDEFIDGRHQLTQIVLAAVVGCPEIAVPWFKQIFGRPDGDAAAALAPLDDMAKANPRARALVDRLRACPELQSWPRLIEVCSLAARYSFETGALLELLPA